MERKQLKNTIVDKILRDVLESIDSEVDLIKMKSAFKDSRELIDVMFLNYVPEPEDIDNHKDIELFLGTMGSLFSQMAGALKKQNVNNVTYLAEAKRRVQ